MNMMTFPPFPGILGWKDWHHCFPYKRHHCRLNNQLDHHPRQNHHCNSPQPHHHPWLRCEEGGERSQWRSDSWPVFQWDCWCWWSQSWWRTVPYLANPTAALGVHKYQREENIKFLIKKLRFAMEPCSCEHRRHGSLTRGMNETRAEIPRKVLLQEGLWVAPEWVVEDIEGDLQFLADPRPMTQFLRTQRTHTIWASNRGTTGGGFHSTIRLIHVTLDKSLILRDLITDDSDDGRDV